MFLGAAALNAASKFSRSLSLQREFAASSAKRLRQKVSISLNNSANSAMGKLISDSPSRAIHSKKTDSIGSGEITVHTPLLSRIESPLVESPDDDTYKARIREVGSHQNRNKRNDGKNGVDNSAYRNSYTDDNNRQTIEPRVSSAATSTGNTNEISSSNSDLKVNKEKVSNSIGSRSRLSSVDVT